MAKTLSKVRISPIASYSEAEQMRSFIRRVFEDAPSAFESLLAAGSAGLAVLKPNWIQESHEYQIDVWEPVITHPAVVLAVAETLAEKMKGQGTICLCDAPHSYANFDAIVSRGTLRNRLQELRTRWPNLNVELIDLRREVWIRKEEVVIERRRNPEDPRAYVKLNLGPRSLFYGKSGEGRYYGADYDSSVVNQHHSGERHEYLLAGSPMSCHLFINLPKLKTHKKTGITCSLKNLVGINGDKNWLPHHTEGSPENGGDEFPERKLNSGLETAVKKAGQRIALTLPAIGPWLYRKSRNLGKLVLGNSQRVVRNGNWHGNDTCWRMALDLNRALLYGEMDGSWRTAGSPKSYLSIVDGIIGGEGDGPLCPTAVESRVLIGGKNAALVDAVAARVMGFEPRSIPLVWHAFDKHFWPIAPGPLSDVTVLDERVDSEIALDRISPAVPGGFRPHFGWANHLQKSAA